MKNPTKFTKDKMPLIVFSDHSSGWIQFLIKWRTKGNYNHVMLMLEPGEFVSQGNSFSKCPISRYMTDKSRLKFYRITDLTEADIALLYGMVEDDLNGSWWSRHYDYPGIIGQALGISKINSPGRMYCSERVAKYLRALLLQGIPKHPSPAELNEVFKNHARMQVFGRWAAD